MVFFAGSLLASIAPEILEGLRIAEGAVTEWVVHANFAAPTICNAQFALSLPVQVHFAKNGCIVKSLLDLTENR